MTWVAVAVGVGGAVVGGAITAKGAKSAANTQAAAADRASENQLQAAREANDLQKEMFLMTRGDQQPWLSRGNVAGNQMAHLLGLNDPSKMAAGSLLTPYKGGVDLKSDPGYQFRLSEGNKALDRSAAARGGLYSGAALKALSRYNQDSASQEYTNAFNRDQQLFNRDQVSKNQIYNMLAGVSGTGQTSAAQLGQLGSSAGSGMANTMNNAATQVGNNMMGAGNARASGYLAQGNTWGNALNQGVAAWQRYGGGGNSTPMYGAGGTQAPANGTYDTTGFDNWARYGND